MLRIGLIVNPIAGLGGPAGLKGSDGDAYKQALAMGFSPLAESRVVKVLKQLSSITQDFQVVTCAGKMGADACRLSGVPCFEVYEAEDESTAVDTERAAQLLIDHPVDILVFAGGDGTARNIWNVVSDSCLVLGIPSGVKMHSGVFAVTPEAATDLLVMLSRHQLVGTMVSQVRDLDEDELRAGHVNTRYYGEMLTPCEGRYLQHVKCGGIESEELVQADIAAFIVETMLPGQTYVLGSGSTIMAVKNELGIDGTLLGLDVIKDHELIAKDVDERQLYELSCQTPLVLFVTLIGGQGHVFGRGNQQLSARVITKIGLQNIRIIATKAKIKTLEGRPMIVDTGDEHLDNQLSGFKTIITGYDDTIAYPLGNPEHFRQD